MTLVVAHRGFPLLAPENTVAGFLRAVDAGADMIETDVRCTKDGHLVLMHDPTLDRTTDASGPVRDRSLAALRQVSVGGEPLPTLAEALDRVPVPFMVDFEEADVVAPLTELLRANPSLLERVVVSGANVAAHTALRKALPSLAVALTLPWPLPDRALEAARDLGATYVNPPFHALTPTWIAQARSEGFKVSTWTVDDPRDMDRVLAWGVDLLITNRPDLAVARRSRWIRSPHGPGPGAPGGDGGPGGASPGR